MCGALRGLESTEAQSIRKLCFHWLPKNLCSAVVNIGLVIRLYHCASLTKSAGLTDDREAHMTISNPCHCLMDGLQEEPHSLSVVWSRCTDRRFASRPCLLLLMMVHSELSFHRAVIDK
jgi:hypothetical protein